jgi:NAD-specific glutamate dehydrogenase
MMDETGCQAEQAVIAYHIAVDIYDLRKVTGLLHNHAYNFERKVFLSIYDDIRSLLRHSAKWLIQNITLGVSEESSETVKMLSTDIKQLAGLLFKRLEADMPEAMIEKKALLREYGLPEDIEAKLLCLHYYPPLVNIAFAARSVDGVKADFMTIYYSMAKRLNINWMLEQVDGYDVDSVWTQAAKVGVICEIENLQRKMSVQVYTKINSKQLSDEAVADFLHDTYGEGVSVWDDFFAEISALPTYNFSIFSVMLKRLQDLSRVFTQEAAVG